MAEINPQRIYGNWLSGIALDVHTLSSIYLGVNEAGHDVFENTRSELGELLYRLKYRADKSAAKEIIETASAFLMRHRSKFDIMVPVPPSGARAIQPVVTVARGIGEAIGLPVVECITLTRPATQLKGVIDRDKRRRVAKRIVLG
jgi:predicted amidophosphoribosyltransferase